MVTVEEVEFIIIFFQGIDQQVLMYVLLTIMISQAISSEGSDFLEINLLSLLDEYG
jgi:hypothetical protein